jgi:hypothetical protein
MALSVLVQKLKNRSSLSSQNGQALVEYVLVLVVSVALVMALAAQVFTPFRDFLKAYMGDYIACLLETGELPSLGNESTKDLLAEEGCNASFQAATVAGGRPPSSSKAAAEQQAKNKQGSSDSGSGGSSAVGPGSAGSNSTGGNLLVSSMKRKTATEVASAASKTTEIPLAEGGSKFYNRRNSYSEGTISASQKSTYVGVAGLTEEEKKKQERKENTNRSIATGENFAPPPKKIPVKKPEPKPDVIAEESPMTFGNFFRFLLIAAIVIALVMVLGSQALKIAKSQEK